MNYKHFFPTFRKRYMFLLKSLKKIESMNEASKRNLNLGAGEGDLNPLINKYCQELYACDVNKYDVKYGQKLNQSVLYSVQDGQNLSYQDNYFDAITCIGTFTYGHVKANTLEEFIRITKQNGLICFTINEGIYTEYKFDRKIEELTKNNLWEILEFDKSSYIVNKDVEAWFYIAKKK